MSDGLIDLGTIEGDSERKQKTTVRNHLKKFFEAHPEVLNGKLSLDACTADDLDDGIIGKFGDWIRKSGNTKIDKYSAHDQYISAFHTILHKTPRFTAKVNQWDAYYSKVRFGIFDFEFVVRLYIHPYYYY